MFTTRSVVFRSFRPLISRSCIGVKPFHQSASAPSTSTAAASILKQFADQHWDDKVSVNDPTVVYLRRELLKGSRAALAEAITLVESTHPTKRAQGDALLAEMLKIERKRLKQHGPNSLIFRIGISGSPGVGKSTFIEYFGNMLIKEHGKKVAVLTVDPSSQTTGGMRVDTEMEKSYGGSILGDITRMGDLARHPNAYIRQSPSHGTLGGVTRGTHEAIILCEGAGYDIVLIETVGVGQSEASVANMVDMYCLLLSPAHGDELQGVKRGIMELTDLIVVTKADGELANKARVTAADYISALKYMRPRAKCWKSQVLRASSMTGEGVPEVWDTMWDFWGKMRDSGALMERRNGQLVGWMWEHIQEEIMHLFRSHPQVLSHVRQYEQDIKEGTKTPGLAAELLLRNFLNV